MRKIILSCAAVLAALTALPLSSCKNVQTPEYYPPSSSAGTNAQSGGESSQSGSDSSDSSDILDSTEKQEGTFALFDTGNISEAYFSGDTSSLSDKELAIYNKACEIVGQYISDDMDDYEKELAIHDYLIINCTYDSGSLSAIPRPGENCEDPYGALIDGEAVCSGYTTAFKLFMDMLEIPCGVVYSCDTEGDTHAWNTVCLDGSWYYVDCTWDDPVPDSEGRSVTHKFFNLSYEEISERHVLPENCPETDSVSDSFANREAVEISDISQVSDAVAKVRERGYDSVVLLFSDNMGVEIEIDGSDLPDEYGDLENYMDEDTALAIAESIRDAGAYYSYCIRRQTDAGTALMVYLDY